MRQRRFPRGIPATAVVVALLFLASNVGGAFPAGSPCGGKTLCICCEGEEAECRCPADSPCGCRDAVKGHPPDTVPAVGIAAPLPEGAPAVRVLPPGRSGAPVSPDRLTSGLAGPETPPPKR